MVVTGARSFERTNPVSRYWLARCEGFTVRSGRRVLGAVAEVGGPDPFGAAEYLVVCRHPRLRRDRTLVPAERVTEVIPARKTLIVDAAPGGAAVRSRRAVHSARQVSTRAARAAAPVALSLARLAVALVGALLQLVLLLLAFSAQVVVRVAGEGRRRLPPALAATGRLVARLGGAARTRAGPALARRWARKPD